jgi:hypothetical protein
VGEPAGGNFSGQGVAFGVFNPALAGPGTHTVTYEVNQNGCLSTATTQITVRETPAQPQILVQGAMLLSSAADSNQWYLNGQPIAGAVSSSWQPTQPGLYQVRVSNGECESPLSAAYEVLNVTASSLEQAGIRLYPNPSEGRAWLDLSAFAGENLRLEVRNGLGQLVWTAQSAGEQLFEIDLQQQAEGVYIIQILATDKLFTGRLLLQH